MNVNGMVLFRKSVSTFYSFLFLNSFQFSKWVKAIVAIDARINGLWSNRTHSLGAPFRGVGPTCGHDFENGARVYRTQYGTRRDLPTRQFWRETEELHMKFFMKCKQNRHDWWNKYICLNRLPSSRKNWFFLFSFHAAVLIHVLKVTFHQNLVFILFSLAFGSASLHSFFTFNAFWRAKSVYRYEEVSESASFSHRSSTCCDFHHYSYQIICEIVG